MTPEPAAKAVSLRETLRAADGPVTLLGYDPGSRPLAPGSKAKALKALASTGEELAAQQEMLYAGGASGDPRRVLLVLQGTDTSGKDGVVSHVVGQVGPAGVRITSFKKPTAEEAAHHFLWRIRRALPPAGLIGVFNRSHYEDVLVTRVHQSIDDAAWAERIADINAFERQLVESGTVLLKCFLHISYTEQRKRLLARLDDPTKYWKFNPADIDERAYWSDYQAAYAAAIAATSTEHAPWYIVPSDTKWYRNWAISQLLRDALLGMELSYPKADFDIEAARARLQPPF
ncbi:MAG TPA: PPK2 family polyphosphate kinase [Jatrophihabitans sp.]|jgi:PPK2 family polyphosphate:nucleotide phosphotransferase|uniref:PPK2 family polyphosphate kinase n=1 Tax=Jatrophihabitans sp. TaxID=1932789 RepID=UPI002F05EFA6